jgi:hypothetical protein
MLGSTTMRPGSMIRPSAQPCRPLLKAKEIDYHRPPSQGLPAIGYFHRVNFGPTQAEGSVRIYMPLRTKSRQAER